MSAVLDKFTGRDPADVLAEDFYAAMCAQPPHVALAGKLTRATSAKRKALLAQADDATRAAAMAWLSAPLATRERDRRMEWLRADLATRLPPIKRYYSQHLASFIRDLGMTHDPRLADKVIPFDLFPRQIEMIEAMIDSYRNTEPLSIPKARDSGASWCAMALLVSLALFEDGFTAIVGSQLEIKIDQSGTTGTLFHKIRMFLEYLPVEFRGNWALSTGSANMRVWFPNGSSIQGEAGEAIGRGGRASVVCLDEYAHLEHPDTIDQALMATSETKWYISSVNGTSNPFAERVREGKTKVFYYRWTDDPRKTEAWAKKKIAADGQRKFDQEYGCAFNVGSIDQMFQQAHLDALIDAHVTLEVQPNGRRFGGFDPGGGGDPSAFCITEGPVITHIESWPSTPNLKKECRHAFAICDRFGITEFNADCCGIGNGLESITAELNEDREEKGLHKITVHPFKASETPLNPNSPCVPGSSAKAKDWYPNKKSQAYDSIRYRARLTYQMIQGETGDPEYLISISSEIPVEARNKLLLELQQITCKETSGGKLAINKYGDDNSSPNMADALALAAAPRIPALMISDEVLELFAADTPPDPYATMYPRGY
jgi:phage terminase large subunit